MKIFRRVVFVFAVIFVCAQVGAQFLPLAFNVPDIISKTDLQSTRAQRITKDALLLAYSSSSNEHALAVSELQITLPAWEAQQATLRLLKNPDSRALVAQSQLKYSVIDQAAKTLLAHPTGKVDLTEVQIILDNEQGYTSLMSQLAALRQTQIQTNTVNFFIAQTILLALIAVTTILLFMFPRQAKPAKQEEGTNG